MKFIHLTDTHLLGAASDKLYGIKPAKRLKKAFKNIREHHKDAEFVVITGDLTNEGDPKAYRLLKKQIDALGIPVFPLVGNHDNRAAFWEVFPEWNDGGFVQHVRLFEAGAFVFLDTLVEGEEYGMMCDARLAWLKKQLEDHAQRDLYLFLHHHPITSGLHRMDTVGSFRSAKAFWSLLESHSNVRHIFFGHIHRPLQAIHRGIPLSTTRSTTFQVAYRPDEPEESLTTTVQPAYSVVRIDAEETVIHLCEYLGEYSKRRAVL